MKRDYKLDLIRVISMSLVIVIHVANIYNRNINNISSSSYVFSSIYNALARVSVPLFFMISGALLIPREDDFQKYKKRITSMLIPLISWSVIYFIWDIFILNKKYNTINTLFKSLFVPIKANLWFMYALIGIYIVLPFIRKIFNNTNYKEDKLFIYLWIIFSGLIYIFRIILGVYNISNKILYPIPMIQDAYYLGYFILGHFLYKHKEKFNIKNIHLLIIFIINIYVISMTTILISFVNNSYYELLFGYRSIFYIIASSSFMLYILNSNIKEKTISVIKKVEPYSFGIYFFHALLINLLNRTTLYKLHASVGVLLYSLIIFIFSYVIIYLMKKSKILRKII